MAQQQPPQNRTGAVGSGRGTSQFIEKGWTVYDAEQRPIGNVTEIDTDRSALFVDGRPQGFDSYEIPMDLVNSAGNNEVHLSKVIDTSTGAMGGIPSFVDRRTTTTTSAPSRSRSRTRVESTPVVTTTETRRRGASATTTPTSEGTMREFTPPYASRHPTMGPEGVTPSWGTDDDNGWSAKKIAMAGLALSGLAGTAYLMRRRMRRKTPFEQFMDMAGDYVGVASEFARDRHPAWWASLVAAALPAAYYAWPSRQPAPTKQTHELDGYLSGFADRLPSLSDFELPTPWKSSARAMDWNFSPRPDTAGTLGALAAGILAVFLIRRATTRPQPSARIADVMTRSPRVIQPDATVADAAAIMRQMDVGALPVCDGSRLIGMLTDRDITIRATADGRDPHLTPVRDVMSPGVAWATEDDPVEAAARIMREHRIRRLPIVNERHSLVGVVSLGDLAVEVADDDMSGDTLERISEHTRPTRDW